jgi:hypothetical protein
MSIVKGMVQVFGTTYRIVKRAPCSYEVVRILDDRRVGTFRHGPSLSVSPEAVDFETLREIAYAALRSAKTSWVGPLSFT